MSGGRGLKLLVPKFMAVDMSPAVEGTDTDEPGVLPLTHRPPGGAEHRASAAPASAERIERDT